MDEDYQFYNKKHLQFLMDQYVSAYKKQDFIGCYKLREQINNVKHLLNSLDRVKSETINNQKVEKEDKKHVQYLA
jgi:hypothetical protein